VSPGRFGRLTDAPVSLLLAGVRVVDPSDGSDGVRDLGIVDGRFADPGTVPPTAERIDGHGLVAAPGLCDLHAHLRDPGDGSAETIATGSRAAAHGGFTTICAMPNTHPPTDGADRVAAVAERAADAACRVRVIGAVTVDRAGLALADLPAMTAAGAVAFSDDGSAVPSPAVAAGALRALAGLGRPLIEHAEDARLAGAGVMRAGPTATRLGLRGWPPEAELAVVKRDLALAEASGARVHLTHLSSAASLDAVRRAKARGMPVTCDVTPHHLALSDAWVGGDRRFAWETAESAPIEPSHAYEGDCRVNPPLASRADALALLAGVADGSIDAIATDHAPHPASSKRVPFEDAAPGLVGLETALSVGIAAVDAGRLALPELIAALSTRPASIIGEPRGLAVGAIADVVVFDPQARWRVDAAALASASANTPLLGMELPGVVHLTVADGRVTYRG
jgi:dihydroorotase